MSTTYEAPSSLGFQKWCLSLSWEFLTKIFCAVFYSSWLNHHTSIPVRLLMILLNSSYLISLMPKILNTYIVLPAGVFFFFEWHSRLVLQEARRDPHEPLVNFGVIIGAPCCGHRKHQMIQPPFPPILHHVAFLKMAWLSRLLIETELLW